jgi:hypothetical protein
MKRSVNVLVALCGAVGGMFGSMAGSSQLWINVLVGGGMSLLLFYLIAGYFLKQE